MKYLPLLAVLTFGSFTNLTFAQRAPVGFSSESAKNVAQTILSRIYEVSGGVDNIAAIREGKTTVVGYYNMKGSILFLDSDPYNNEEPTGIDRVHGGNVIPFEIELRSDGSKLIRVAGLHYNGEGDAGSPFRKVKLIEYTFDDRSPQITISQLRMISLELALSVLGKNGSWVGPVLDAELGGDLSSYNLQGTNFQRPYPSVEKLTIGSTAYFQTLIGIGFAQKIGSLNLKGKVGYQIYVSTKVDKFTDAGEAEKGTLTNMEVSARRSSLNSEFSLSKNVGKTRIGIFYEGQYYRTDRVRGFDGKDINVAPLGVQTPHRAGIRVNF